MPEARVDTGKQTAYCPTGQGVLDQNVILARAEQDAHRRLVAVAHHVSLVPGDIGIELAEMLVPEFVHLQLDQHMAFQDAMVKDQVHESMGVADEDSLLPRLETETVAQFHAESPAACPESASSKSDSPMTSLDLMPRNSKTYGSRIASLGSRLFGTGLHQFCQFFLVPG